MTSPATSRTTFGARLASLVSEAPDAPALTDDDGTLSRAELDSISRRWAERLLGLGVRTGDIERAAAHDVTWLYAVPTIMSRIAKLPAEVAAAADLSSLRTLYHMAAPCPSWLKRWWIDRIGPEKVWELYTGTEFQAVTIIGGDGWLAHPGSVGTVQLGSMMVLDDDGNQVPPNQVGEIYLRAPGGRPTYTYLGGTAKARGEWESLGDVGSMDADGYVYLSDRAKDIVLVGGVNVYPAEVEAALDAHPLVLSCCVVGLPDEDLGERLHAVVQLADDLDDDAILDFLSGRLASYKHPRSFSRSEVPLRDEAGKVRRAAVRELVLAEAGPGSAGGR